MKEYQVLTLPSSDDKWFVREEAHQDFILDHTRFQDLVNAIDDYNANNEADSLIVQIASFDTKEEAIAYIHGYKAGIGYLGDEDVHLNFLY